MLCARLSVWTIIAIVVGVWVQLAVSVASYGFLFRSLNGVERGGYTIVALSGFLGFTYDTVFWYVAVILFLAMSGYVYITKKA